ncbi:malonate decarboxylase subunit epsilon [Providencia burhodogranariea]|uniref:Malonyl CoA-acyl carrier protein transacylase n=1 Tax=Providencia burhodogranariea DSM 19968 TaxID=1141662 RepID=K8X1N2_9GAMM|nr:malonate decarboxylase subunit epsilon [Providencia burhodogranariea]EKT63567.1 malonate decarboxylase subunit epsilon [Providencia burhodogranariea DSM 19968]
MKIAFTFPGQGSQVPNMLHQLPRTVTSARLLEQACDVLHEDVLTLDSATTLKKTRAVQLCLLIAGVAYARELEEHGVTPHFTSGLSIGAYPAAVIAGALEYTDAVQLVSLRGELMENAYPKGYGLSVIIGLPQRVIETLIEQVNTPQMPVYLANINSEDQLVIAGSDESMQKVMLLAKQKGAHKTHQLAVSVPSHCALLTEPAHELAQAMLKVILRRPDIAYLSGSSARVLWQPEKIADDLAFNMSRTVHWHDTMVAAYEREIRLSIEMPPGTVLTGLTKKVMEQGEAISLEQSGIALVIALAKRLTHDER